MIYQRTVIGFTVKFSTNQNTETWITQLQFTGCSYKKQGRKRPLDTPERKIERRERDSNDGNTKKYDRERERERERWNGEA